MALMNRVTRGLLSLLDAKTQGQNPRTIGEEVVPVLDVTNFLVASKQFERIQAGASGAPTTNSTWASLNVPQDELWLIYGLTSQVRNNDVGITLQQLRLSTVFIDPALTYIQVGNVTTGNAGLTVSPNNGRSGVSSWFPTPLVLQPNWYIATLVEQAAAFAGADPTYFTSAYICRLQI